MDERKNNRIKEYFEMQFQTTDPWHYFTSLYEQKKYQRQLILIKDRLVKPMSILEIGCAEGAHTKMIMQEFPEAEIIGVDISLKAITRAKRLIKSNRVNFVCGDITTYIDNIDNFFDIIIWSESVYYIGEGLGLPDIFKYLDKLISKLKSGGLLCMANIIDQQNAPETPLTRRPIMNCYFALLSHFIKPVHSSCYLLEYKKENDQYFNYEIWLFRKQ